MNAPCPVVFLTSDPSIADTPYYHITSHCVPTALRGAGSTHSTSWGRLYVKHICAGLITTQGRITNTGDSVVDRIRLLSSLFAIDVCAYAVMSNHYHLVLKLCPEQLQDESDKEVMDRWCALFKGPILVQRYRQGDVLTAPERSTVADIVNVWQAKLSSISWFMRCLNQPIARQANLEDKCTGKFGNPDLDPSHSKLKKPCCPAWPMWISIQCVRGIETSPEISDHTSIQERLAPVFDLKQAINSQLQCGDLLDFKSPLNDHP